MIYQAVPRPAGSSSRAKLYQYLYDAHGAHRPNDVSGTKVSRTTRGFYEAPEPTSSASATGKVRKLILSDAAAADYLVCRPWDELYWSSRQLLEQTSDP